MEITINNITIGYQEPYLIKGEVQGLGNPINNPVGFEIPFSNKSSFISNYARSRVITIDFQIVSDTKQEYLTNRQNLINALYIDENTINTIEIRDSAGNEYITYGVLAGQPDLPIMYVPFSDCSISFICYDIFLYDSVLNSETVNINQSNIGVMLPTMVPFTLLANISQTSITNEGIKAYPIYTISGPGTNFTIQNSSTGEYINIGYSGNNYTKSNFDIVIDTYNNTVIENGVSIYQYFRGDFIPLQNGVNNISFNAESGFTGLTTLTISYRTTYLGI
jgi:hypothetical protein